MIIVLDQFTNSEESIKTFIKSFNKQLELKSTIGQKIKNTKGGEKLFWIKKYNSLFIHQWGYNDAK